MSWVQVDGAGWRLVHGGIDILGLAFRTLPNI